MDCLTPQTQRVAAIEVTWSAFSPTAGSLDNDLGWRTIANLDSRGDTASVAVGVHLAGHGWSELNRLEDVGEKKAVHEEALTLPLNLRSAVRTRHLAANAVEHPMD